jgi:integrase
MVCVYLKIRRGTVERTFILQGFEHRSADLFHAAFWCTMPDEPWSQVDLTRKVIRLTETKNGSARNVPMNSVSLAALKKQRKLVAHKPGDLVFPEAGDYCRFWFEPSVAEAKITEYTWHNNRHTFCSWLALAGVSLKEIQELAGHKTIAMSARYAHLSPERTATASERLVSEP